MCVTVLFSLSFQTTMLRFGKSQDERDFGERMETNTGTMHSHSSTSTFNERKYNTTTRHEKHERNNKKCANCSLVRCNSELTSATCTMQKILRSKCFALVKGFALFFVLHIPLFKVSNSFTFTWPTRNSKRFFPTDGKREVFDTFSFNYNKTSRLVIGSFICRRHHFNVWHKRKFCNKCSRPASVFVHTRCRFLGKINNCKAGTVLSN